MYKTEGIGNIGKDVEIKYLQNGTAVANTTICFSKVWKDKSGQKQKKDTWVKLTIWREPAETFATWVKKGAKLYVEGEMSATAYIDKKTDEPRASLELTIDKWEFAGSKPAGDEAQSDDSDDAAPVKKPSANTWEDSDE